MKKNFLKIVAIIAVISCIYLVYDRVRNYNLDSHRYVTDCLKKAEEKDTITLKNDTYLILYSTISKENTYLMIADKKENKAMETIKIDGHYLEVNQKEDEPNVLVISGIEKNDCYTLELNNNKSQKLNKVKYIQTIDNLERNYMETTGKDGSIYKGKLISDKTYKFEYKLAHDFTYELNDDSAFVSDLILIKN